MNVRFTVGEFAKLCGVSKQTLIFYDKEDIIKPSSKDEFNGYRYYTADQLEQMDTIMILREMGLSLKEIRAHMQNRSLESSLLLLESQEKAIREKIEHLRTVEGRIRRKMESLQEFSRKDIPFQLRELPEQLLAWVGVRAPGGLLEVDIALKKLMKQVAGNGANHLYQMGDTVPRESLLSGSFLTFSRAFLPVEREEPGMNILRKPAGLYAVRCHFGPYDTMGETYRRMLEEIRSCGKTVAGDSYEFCVLDSLTTSTPEHYCTQIQIPVE